jgi:protein SCO1/2
MKISSLVAVLFLLLTSPATGNQPGLPYYGDKTLAPVWSADAATGHVIAEFEAINQQGEAIDNNAGLLRVVNFFFATCPGICTTTMRNLLRVQDAIAGTGGQMMSFSITPNIDTPEKLTEYARYTGIEDDTWQLLTGSEAQVNRLARDSFFAVLNRNTGQDAFVHTEKAYLVDRQGHIRGVYNATSAADLLRLVEDYELLNSL